MNGFALASAVWSLEAAGVAAVIVDDRGQAQMLTASAQRICSRSRHLRRHLGRLRASRAADDQRLQDAIAQACGGPASPVPPACELVVGSDDECWRMIVRRLPGNIFAVSAPPPAWAVVFVTPDRPQPLAPLTKAEAAILDLICRGLDPAEIATLRSVRPESIRIQLKAIYAKFGVSGRAALIAKMAGAASRVPPS